MTKISLFCSDIDFTLVGKPEATESFKLTWNALDAKKRPLLVYATGRLFESAQRIIKQSGLPTPDYLICSVGTQTYNMQDRKILKDFETHLNQSWDRKVIDGIMKRHPKIEKQGPQFQNNFKSSWYFYHASLTELDKLQEEFKKAGQEADIIYSSSRDLDVVPKRANKGNALNWLAKKLKIPTREVVVAGDSGNDAAMFTLPNVRGIVVGNAEPELQKMLGETVYLSKSECANGVLEGLQHFGLISEPIHSPIGDITNDQYAPEVLRLFGGDKDYRLQDEDIAFLKTAYGKAIEVVKRNVTPMGFTACDIEANQVVGTEENYFSVWSRDGCITLIGTLKIQDKKIQACQKATLDTLLKNLSPHGQVPSYVTLKDKKPCFSGLGGISSVDSNLWFIIAFYEYIRETGQLSFLKNSVGKLRSTMNWLKGLDTNNDELLEIPEAGDWADLFGNSYHVLYDEVLWYRANISFGFVLEMLHAYSEATFYFKRAQKIKTAILEKFWPTSEQSSGSFTDSQKLLGDVKYMICQVSPFKHNWRCDVYGNILAGIYNILDASREKTMFRFLWGVGVNDPHPVQNIYPIVHSGAHDWHDYYAINSLNLPYHYHNGGVWPYIGGFWVQLVHKLGLFGVACQELIRLAKVNQQGIYQEWEFNEWLHGRTGRPMGKAFQAWSASQFIYAFSELGLQEILKQKT